MLLPALSPSRCLPPTSNPSYDFAVDCKAYQAQLAAARDDLEEEQGKGAGPQQGMRRSWQGRASTRGS
jgi:hypothetical protein